MEIPPRMLADRVVCRIHAAFKLASPRVGFSYFSMVWNRPITSRRYQGRRCCAICGGAGTWDSIEHYISCPRVDRVARVVFRALPPDITTSRSDRLAWYFALTHNIWRSEFVRRILLLHVVYSLQNECRERGFPAAEDRVVDMARSSLMRAAQGNRRCLEVARALLRRSQVGEQEDLRSLRTATRRPV